MKEASSYKGGMPVVNREREGHNYKGEGRATIRKFNKDNCLFALLVISHTIGINCIDSVRKDGCQGAHLTECGRKRFLKDENSVEFLISIKLYPCPSVLGRLIS